MDFICRPSRLAGRVDIPASKSHTIRAVAFASLADGVSRIEQPLDSSDAQAVVRTYRALGAKIEHSDDVWTVNGTGGRLNPPDDFIDVGNSGTTLRVAIGSAALLTTGQATFTGDDQIQRRPLGPLLQSINDLGGSAESVRGN